MGVDFGYVRVGCVFNAADDPGFEVLPFFDQFGDAFGGSFRGYRRGLACHRIARRIRGRGEWFLLVSYWVGGTWSTRVKRSLFATTIRL